MSTKYHALKRLPGKKWRTVATVNVVKVSCLASAAGVFKELGITCDYVDRDSITGQNNWVGYSADCKHFNLYQVEQDNLNDRDHARFYWKMNPDLEYWRDRLDPGDFAAVEPLWHIF